MTTRRDVMAGAVALGMIPVSLANAVETVKRGQVLDTMKRATEYMVDTVAVHGGYVWSYLPDMSRRWGEMEAFPSMVWVQPPGTGTMGHVFLDAYHATGDQYYYECAQKCAEALIAGQLASGGWHYFIDFGGIESTKRWYDTIGRNAWRLEEFQHYWGNATFDDAGTSEAMQFLLRLYVEKKDERYRPALDKAIDFVLESQYPIGGWPQRFPHTDDYIDHGKPDYTSFITFNDDVAGENIRFLIMVWQALGDKRVLDAITRAMSVFLVTQQGQPQPGWALQYTLDLKPSGARTYEPTALATHTTVANIRQLMNFYRLTGESKYLSRIPEAITWLEGLRLPDADGKTNRYPTFVELGSNRALYVHRRGSNVVNGEYYADGDPEHTVGHYSSVRILDLAALRAEFEALRAISPDEVSAGSPLTIAKPLDRYFLTEMGKVSDLNTPDGRQGVQSVVKSLNRDGYWPTPLKATSHPYSGDGSAEVQPGDFRSTRVGDMTDTSPYIAGAPVIGISTGSYIENMETLIGALGEG